MFFSVRSRNWLIYATLLLLAYGIWHYSGEDAVQGDDRQSGSYPLTRQLIIEFSLRNPAPRSVSNAELRFSLPVRQTPHQRVESVELADQVPVYQDDYGNQVAVYQYGNMAARQRENHAVSVNLAFSATANTLSQHEILPRLLSDEPVLDIRNPAIQQLVERIRQDSAADLLNGILAWMREHVDRQTQTAIDTARQHTGPWDEDVPASQLIQTDKFTGEDAVVVFTALARALGIPVDLVLALDLPVDSDEVVTYNRLQIYPQVYVDDRWLTIDLASFSAKTVTPASAPQMLVIRRLEYVPGKQQLMEPYRLLYEAVGAELMPESIRYHLTS